jgi:cobalt-zinc-cadmium efflux system membrane fusion protein
MKKYIFIVFLILVAQIEARELVVNVNNSMVKTVNPIKTQQIYLGSFLAGGHLSANKIYRIDTPVGAIVEHLGVHIYDTVKKGELLLTLKSPKMLELESKYIDLLIEKEYCKSEVDRLKPLYDAAVVAKKSFLKAQNTLTKFTTQSEFYYHLLIAWGLSKSQVETITKTKKPIPEIKIYSPIAGKVSDLNIYPKMYVQSGEHLMTILNTNGTHLEVALPSSIAKRLHIGSTLFIGDKAVKVESIAAKLDSRTQTVAIHLVPNEKMNIMPDEKRNIKLYWPQSAFSLSSSAVIDFNDKEAVFIKTSDGFRLVYVTVLGRNSDKVYVISKELKSNSEVAISGVIALKGALESKDD